MTMTNDHALYYFDAKIEIPTMFVDYAKAFIMLIWRLCGCWITEKLALTQSDIIFGLFYYR